MKNIKRIPRIRRNEWASCFYDCLYTYLDNPVYFESFGNLILDINNNPVNSWSDIVFPNPSEFNLTYFYNLRLQEESFTHKDSTNSFIAKVNVTKWKKHKYYNNKNRKKEIHYVVVNKINNNIYSIIDPYYSEIYEMSISDIRKGIISKIIIDLNTTNNYTLLNFETYLVYEISTTLKNLLVIKDNLLYNINKNDSGEILTLYKICEELANRIELFYLRFNEYFYEESEKYKNQFIRIILKFQYIRKVWIKNCKSITQKDSREINEYAISNFIDMVKLFNDIKEELAYEI